MEKYIGTGSFKKEFNTIEKELAKIIKMIKSVEKPFGTMVVGSHILNTSDHTKLIERMFTKIFDLKEFSLNWVSNPDPNAYTYCKTFIIFDRNFNTLDDGHRTNNKLFVNTTMHTGLISHCDLNEKELLGIILHEIGHNFYDSVYNILSRMTLDVKKTVSTVITSGIFDLVNFQDLIYKGNKMIGEWISKNIPTVDRVIYTVRSIMLNLAIFRKIKSIADVVLNFPAGFVIGLPAWISRYNVEKFADSFATDYGYGQHLSSGLDKLVKNKGSVTGTVIEDYPFIGWAVDLFDLMFAIFAGALGTYPTPQNRIRTCLDRLKRSASDPNLPPKVKKELEEQIESFEAYYHDTYLASDNDDNKRRVFTTVYKQAVEKLFAGKMDVRELTHALDPKKYS